MTRTKTTPCRWKAGLTLLAWLPLTLWAQTPAAPEPLDWRSANDAVGQFKRGHMDILKWEQAQASPDGLAPSAPSLSLLREEDAVRQAWRAHADLATPLARLGAANADLIASGRWQALDLGLLRIADVDEVLEVAAQARKAWLQAVAAQQALGVQGAALKASQAAYELGQCMGSVGNWSRLQMTQVQEKQLWLDF